MEPPLLAVRWRMPNWGAVKVYVHGYFSEEPFPNGNRSGIGVVIRDHRRRLLRLFAGSLGIENGRVNEHYAMFEGLIRAYLDKKDIVELETDNTEVYWEWTNSMIHEMVLIEEPFGQIYEFWSLDMGFGLVDLQFQTVFEDEVNGVVDINEAEAGQVEEDHA
ncbi:hypothetical protein POM88_024158 [Heracleum sosnowskyi]|uniref:RNase H type-1 domain-containing protein n=1 Tax=Heracleum sosnowskyi TaxID=360622 RepID=A0AAD8I2R2_9APIA|nr:hypothetical protein POM88_024158 [Heracleum sosnowskyi]